MAGDDDAVCPPLPVAEMSKPSFLSSTLSILAVWSVAAFTLAACGVGWGLGHGLDKEIAGVIMAPFTILLSGFGMSYLTARRAGNGTPPASPPAEEKTP